MMSVESRICRSSSVTAAGGASIFISAKCALRFFLMRKVRDFRPQYSALPTMPPLPSMMVRKLLHQSFDLLGGNILPRQKYMLVERHDCLSFFVAPAQSLSWAL